MTTQELLGEVMNEETKKTSEEQTQDAVKVAVIHQKALDNLVRLDIRNYLNMLTSPGVKEVDKMQIKVSMERAFMAGMDYGVDVVNQGLKESGKLATIENSFAAHVARMRDNGMLIIANKLNEKEKQNTGENNE